MEKMTINQLPSRTWNRLGVNEATIDWDESATVVLPEESAEKADMLIASDAAYARKRVTIQAEKGREKVAFPDPSHGGQAACADGADRRGRRGN